MSTSVLEKCRYCIATLKTVVTTPAEPNHQNGRIRDQVNDQLERFSLWTGNIGALHRPDSPMSLETRLSEAGDVLSYVLNLLDDLSEVTGELLQIVAMEREQTVAPISNDDCDFSNDDVEQNKEEDLNEENELLKEINACITRLFRVSSLVHQANPTDRFAKALSRNRYRFNDQFDIAHVAAKFPKLATEEFTWLRRRLGRAITHRRHYLCYIQDHREQLDNPLSREELDRGPAPEPQGYTNKQLHDGKLPLDCSSRPSTFVTKASTLAPGRITPQMLTAEQESDSEEDTRSYTTISRSVDGGDLESSTLARIPKLEDLKIKGQEEFECPFCFRMKKFKNERVWRRHVFADLRPYVCTFPKCDAPYYGDINQWFQHEMQNHRVSYTCRICNSKTFYLKKRYLAHIQQHHPDFLEDGDEQVVLEISRKPLDQIPAQDCPCCSSWIDRLKEHTEGLGLPTSTPDNVLTVILMVFKRHLASHLEQLALFAIPIGSSAEGEVDSNVAIEVDTSNFTVEVDEQLDEEEPETAEDFKNNLNRTINNDGLGRFFPPGDTYVNEVAEKAAALRNDPNNRLNSPSQIQGLTTVALYKTILYCDDSQSMREEDRWRKQAELAKLITDIATRADPNNRGVYFHLMNTNLSNADNLDGNAILRTLDFDPDGWTPLGTNLRN
ncbi:hypothetical protein BDBG_18058 [Blastomyces gilchristii SLH14081]|uniref:Oxidoreductase acuF-like C2H2 type zinc-finger domain-containing protein n=1 Tax=Blastomyces gilchristii (strain SLH14081) TaxID=559298 RepID=A0A179V4Y0_BLAGS|nr:uncharacterized protein BDBG_18058 [Blastomyces gilchristii SLH14081]OAT14499.1 hypothetical protein BDBG_18058 [Blastomyces gilchristii SLH14081]